MLRDFKKFIEEHNLIKKGDKVLLALSGGIDSMVLARLLMSHQVTKSPSHQDFETCRDVSHTSLSHTSLSHTSLLHTSKLAFAHCNFHLRGEDSNRDENFVRRFAEENNIPIFIKHFDTELYAKENSLSIEMAARELRYSWFKELKETHGFTKVALAHHGDDQIETFFINLLRGSGIKGLKGMKNQNDFYIRPLLWANRKQIETFAKDNAIQWVEDYTNQENIYLRNKIRNQLMQLFDEIKDGARQSIRFSVDCLTSENELYRSLIEEKLSHLENVNGDYRFIDNKFFLENESGRQLLFEWVRKFGFNYEQSASMFEAMKNGKSGVLFYNVNGQQSADNRLCPCLIASVQKDKIEIFKTVSDNEEYIIDAPVGAYRIRPTCRVRPTYRIHPTYRVRPTYRIRPENHPCHDMSFSVLKKDENFKLEKDASKFAQFDMEKVAFPLKLRHWRKGDRFKPIGMKGSKLLSDFFNDMGFSTYQKQNVWIMEDSNGLILWVVGYRISDKVKITDSTKVIFQCALES